MTDLQLPAHLLNRVNRGIAAQLAVSLPSGTVAYLSIKGGRFTLFDAAGNDKAVGAMDPQLGVYLDVCVVDSNPHVSKEYYLKEYDPNGEGTAPDCWSDNGIAPSVHAAKPQHRDCKTCPHNEWNSSVSRLTGRGTKACADKQKLAIVVPGFSDAVFLLRVPPASLKHLGNYIKELQSFSAAGRKVDICDLTTRVYFQKDAVGVLGFTAAGWVDAATAAVADKVYESKAADAIVGKLDQPYTGEIGLLPVARSSEAHALPPPTPLPPPSMGSPTQPLADFAKEPKKRGRPRKEPVQEAPASQAPFMQQVDLRQPPFMQQVNPQQAPFMTTTSAGPSPVPTNGGATSGEVEDVPDFLKRIESAPGMPPNVTAGSPHDQAQIQHKPAGPSFGMQPAQAAPEDMAARIAAVLAMKTGG